MTGRVATRHPVGAATRVLVVEDNPGDALLTTAALEEIERERFEITVAPTIASALGRCSAADVVLLDVNLPDARRLEGLDALRSNDRQIPIILLTSEADVRLAEAALTYGAQDYLLKDELTPAALGRAIRYARSRQELMVRVEASERWAKALIHSVSDIVTIHGADGTIHHVGGSGGEALASSAEPSLDSLRQHVDAGTWLRIIRTFRRWLRGELAPLEFCVKVGGGGERHFESVATDLRHDPLIQGIVVTTRDVTARRSIEDRLSHEVLHDALTGLPNRTYFNQRLAEALASSSRHDTGVAVLVIDLDDFKKINDSYGHPAGDELLKAVTQSLSTALRDNDTLARLGGDEFVVVCPGVTAEGSHKIARRLQRAMLRPFSAAGWTVYLTASIGVMVVGPGNSVAPPEMFRNADLALYESKRAGRNRITVFDRRLEQQALRRMDVENELHHAIRRDELTVVYQPVIDMTTGTVASYEALLRWSNGRLGDVAAEEFIPVAEACGLISTIGAWVLERACMQLGAWRRDQRDRDRRLAVNVSARQLAEPDFVTKVVDVLRRHDVPATALCLEVTETSLMAELDECSKSLNRIRDLGVTIALDDFGTGYSSLAYLKRLPVDVLKLDKSFIERIDTDPNEQTLVATVSRMAQPLGIEVVAEGVETPEQCEQLRRLGCALAQGFLWSAAVDADRASQLWDQTFDTGDARPASHHEEPAVVNRTRPSDHDFTETTALLVHELMQPITVVRSFASMLRELVDVSDIEQLTAVADAINRNAATIETLVRTLADTGAVDRNTLQLETTPLMLLSAVTDVIDDLSATLPVPVELEADQDIELDLDISRFRQIITNLLTNAGKFSPPAAPIVVRLGERDGNGVVSVIDSGPGVPAEREGELFGKFAKLGQHKGTGVHLQLLERRYGDRLDDKGLQYLGFASEGADRLRAMTDALLDYANIRTSPVTIAPTDLALVVASVRKELEVSLEESGAELTVGSLPVIPASPALLQALLQNLVANAVKFSAGVPRIHIACEPNGSHWLLTVDDAGIGVPPERRTEAFAMFRRLQPRSTHPGHGMGLALCRGIAEIHGGDIWLDTSPLGGTRACVRLPGSPPPKDTP